VRKRVQIEVNGRVQGVGFRPTVYRYARDCDLAGCVWNSSRGVVIELEGEEEGIDRFLDRLRREPPRQARLETFRTRELPPAGLTAFEILPSDRAGELDAMIPPDLATCDECVAELFDPGDRRYGYPFINCTNCGPRFTIIAGLPYDRERTTMAAFRLCPNCRREYTDPSDRRFDAQPNACPVCGPRVRLVDAHTGEVPGDAIAETARLLSEGAIVAVKGLGGFHLACLATDEDVVRRLRDRKGRPAKALAVMFSSLDEIRRHCLVGDREAAELMSPARPIVILKRRRGSRLSRLVSPDTNDVGAFLPYTPLHHLLLGRVGPLVMTSGNRSEEPIAMELEHLRGILGPVADFALDHDRPILRRCDDSVLRMVGGARLFYRRSRGYVPNAIRLPVSGPPVLACGGDLKNTFCVTRGDRAFLSQHVGDLAELAAYRFYAEAIEDWLRTFSSEPEIVAHDLHPDYVSTRYATERRCKVHVAVQHHHAHVAACMAEHGLTERVIGVAFDGTGYGPDGAIWGGEFLVADLASFRRAAHLKCYPMPGGEEAILHPARMALAYLARDLAGDEARLPDLLAPQERSVILRMIARGLRCPLTSSAGRLFDAVAAIVGIRDRISYEGQAAIRLQSLARPAEGEYPFAVHGDSDPMILDFAETIRAIVTEVESGADVRSISWRFHRTVASAVAETCDRIRSRDGINGVVLSGGVFQNDLLLGLVQGRLRERGFGVYAHTEVPPNDGGIALGQAAVAVARRSRLSETGGA